MTEPSVSNIYGTFHRETQVADINSDDAFALKANIKPTPSYIQNSFLIYILSSLFVALVITFTASPNPTTWSTFLADFTRLHPARGEAGFGHFLIRGHNDTISFAYAWRLINRTFWSRFTSWAGYVAHQLGQFYILAQAQMAKRRREITWSKTMNMYGWWMVQLNVVMVVYKIFQGHIWYDGTAQDLPEGTSLASVAMILVVILLMEMPRRGLFFGRVRSLAGGVAAMDMFEFFIKYHAYLFSFGTCYTFHYHPPEATLGHFSGFFYMFLLFWQSSLLFHTSHRTRTWTTALECTVWLHGLLTAIFQGGKGWLVFTYGFASIFVVTQVWGLPYVQRQRAKGNLFFSVPAVLAVYATLVLLGFGLSGNLSHVFFIIFIPTSEYGYLVFYWVAFLACWWIVRGMERLGMLDGDKNNGTRWVKAAVVAVLYFAVNLAVLIGYSVMLGGPLQVYNDYNIE